VNHHRGQQRGPAPWTGRVNYTTVDGIPTGEEGRSSPAHRIKTTIVKLERLRSIRITRRDPKAMKLDMQRL
jgi:hypothetical protein